jgi:hypothetical protein
MKSRKCFTVAYYWAGMAHTLTETFRTRRQAVKVAYGLVNAGFPAMVRRIV